jgi:hypothetical protein
LDIEIPVELSGEIREQVRHDIVPSVEEHLGLFDDRAAKDAAEQNKSAEEADVQKPDSELPWDLAGVAQPVDDRDEQISKNRAYDKWRKDFSNDVEKPQAAENR